MILSGVPQVGLSRPPVAWTKWWWYSGIQRLGKEGMESRAGRLPGIFSVGLKTQLEEGTPQVSMSAWTFWMTSRL